MLVEEPWPSPMSGYPIFFASTKPIFKRIAPSDNMRPKSDNAKWNHRWLKGFNISTCCNPNDAYRIYLVSAISNQNICWYFRVSPTAPTFFITHWWEVSWNTSGTVLVTRSSLQIFPYICCSCYAWQHLHWCLLVLLRKNVSKTKHNTGAQFWKSQIEIENIVLGAHFDHIITFESAVSLYIC